MSESHAHTHETVADLMGHDGLAPLPTPLLRLRSISGLVGLIALGLLILGGLFNGEHFFRSLLFGFYFWLGISLGAMAFVMISHLTGGGWGVVYRRFGEAAFLNVWLMFLFAMVLGLGYSYLFPWAHAKDFQFSDPEAYHSMIYRRPWYTPSWFFVRQLVYFLIWGVWAIALRVGSLKLDKREDPVLRRKLRKISAAGMVMFFVTTTSYAMDYILSRETNWYSSIIGFIIAIEMGIGAMAFCTLMVCYFARRKPLVNVLTPQHLNDLGNLLLALTILWTYTSFAQLLIIWNGNTVEDVGYYTHRGMGIKPNNWRFVAVALIVGHFFIPFFLLLMKGLKRKTATLARICVWLLIMRVVATLWMIAPSGPHRGGSGQLYFTDIAAWCGVGGLWLYNYLRMLGTQVLLPQNATHQPELLTHGTNPHAAHAI